MTADPQTPSSGPEPPTNTTGPDEAFPTVSATLAASVVRAPVILATSSANAEEQPAAPGSA